MIQLWWTIREKCRMFGTPFTFEVDINDGVHVSKTPSEANPSRHWGWRNTAVLCSLTSKTLTSIFVQTNILALEQAGKAWLKTHCERMGQASPLAGPSLNIWIWRHPQPKDFFLCFELSALCPTPIGEPCLSPLKKERCFQCLFAGRHPFQTGTRAAGKWQAAQKQGPTSRETQSDRPHPFILPRQAWGRISLPHAVRQGQDTPAGCE